MSWLSERGRGDERKNKRQRTRARPHRYANREKMFKLSRAENLPCNRK